MNWDTKDTVLLVTLILTICGWIVQHRLSIRVKQKDLILSIINEIRECAILYINDVFERLKHNEDIKNRVPGKPFKSISFLTEPNSDNLIKNVGLIVMRNAPLLGPYKKWKIKRAIDKIATLSDKWYDLKIWDDELHDKYRKEFYKYLNSIGFYD
jgi:hypothetical protein